MQLSLGAVSKWALLSAIVAAGPVTFADTGSAAEDPDATCRAEASSPFEPDNAGHGRNFDDIDPAVAIPACRAAVKANPSIVNQYRLARALIAGGKKKESAHLLLSIESPAEYAPIADALGYMYLVGSGVEKDVDLAVIWYRRSADKGFASAQYAMGWAYQSGQGVEQDFDQAATWYRRGARQGHGSAQQALGYLYETGQGVEKDIRAAVRWYRAAARQGNASGEASLGILYKDGRGVPQNYEEAVKLFRRAARQGNSAAQIYLGDFYRDGTGLPRNTAQARAWYKKAADQGSEPAKKRLDALKQAEAPPSNPKESAAKDKMSKDFEALIRDLVAGRRIEMTDERLMLMGGMAQYLSEKCGLPDSFKDRLVLATLAKSATERTVTLGGQWAMGQMMSGAALFAAGAAAMEQLGCNNEGAATLADAIVRAARLNASNGAGGPSVFVKSCSRSFSQTQCECLANVGRGVIPDIHHEYYDRSIIKRIIQGNPLLGFQIGLACGIVNY